MRGIVCTEEKAYTYIKEQILEGNLTPGTRLVHRRVAEKLDISPIPVLVALRMLERDGLVTNTPGLGATVRTWSREEIIDLFHMRAFVEALAARLCAERATAVDLARLSTAAAAFKDSYLSEDPDSNIRADVDLHMAVVRGAHCPDLARMIENLGTIRRSMRAFGEQIGLPRIFVSRYETVHDQLVETIVAGDPDAAEQAAREHVEESLARNLQWLEQFGAATAAAPVTNTR